MPRALYEHRGGTAAPWYQPRNLTDDERELFQGARSGSPGPTCRSPGRAVWERRKPHYLAIPWVVLPS
jgi:hypothetical protein